MIEVVPNSWWSAGPHRFICGDNEAGAFTALVEMTPHPGSLVYTDPPWGQGNARYWRTYAAKHGVAPVDADWSALMAGLIVAIDLLDPALVCIEMGTRWSNEIARALAPRAVTIHPATYGPRHLVNHLVVASPDQGHILHEAFPVWHGEALTRWVFDHAAVDGGIVVDPFIGRGMTARFAHRAGMICYGVELCPHRLAATLAWLERQGCPVERVA